MDIFNRKRVKELESKISELEEQLNRTADLHSTIYVSRGDAIPLVAAVHMSRDGMEIPIEIVQRQLCQKLADEIYNREMVRFEITDDPRTMSHIIHARIDVINRG